MQGIVFSTNRESAVKVHAQEIAYKRERNVYLRLQEHKVNELHGLIIPNLLDYDDQRKIIEMTVVSPPFIVDFGGAYLDNYPEHASSKDARMIWESEKQEQFGSRWKAVKTILNDFDKLYGVCIVDVNPGNIQFG